MQPITTYRRNQASGRVKRSGVWWTYIGWYNGRKIQKRFETSDRKLAKAIEAKVRTEIVEGSYFEKLIGRKKTFKNMLDRLMKEHAPKVSDSMQRSYITSSKHLLMGDYRGKKGSNFR